MIGKRVVVRDSRAGVFFGTLRHFDGPTKCAGLDDARHIWCWRGALTVEDIAQRGIRYEGSRVGAAVAAVELCDVVSVAACGPEGVASLDAAPVYA